MGEIKKSKNKNFLMFFAVIIFFSIIINLFIRSGYDFSYLGIYPADINISHSKSWIPTFVYVLVKRIKQCFIIFLLMKVINSSIIYNGFLMLLSAFVGIMLTVQTYYYGFAGIVLLLIYMLPQYIVYIVILKNLYEFSFIKRSHECWIRYIMFILLLLLIGVLCESFFLKFFLTKYYQYMVSV